MELRRCGAHGSEEERVFIAAAGSAAISGGWRTPHADIDHAGPTMSHADCDSIAREDAEIASSSGKSQMLSDAKAHDMLAMPVVPKEERRGIEEEEIAGSRGVLHKYRAANDHAETAISRKPNSAAVASMATGSVTK